MPPPAIAVTHPRDSGLLHALLNVPDADTLLTQPWVGASWEGFIIEQALGVLSATGKHFDAYYFRTNDQYEVDLVLDFGRELWALEIKLTASPTSVDLRRLEKAADLIGATRRFLISKTTQHGITGEKRVSCNLGDLILYLRGEGKAKT